MQSIGLIQVEVGGYESRFNIQSKYLHIIQTRSTQPYTCQALSLRSVYVFVTLTSSSTTILIGQDRTEIIVPTACQKEPMRNNAFNKIPNQQCLPKRINALNN